MQESGRDMEADANTVIHRLWGQLAEAKAAEDKYEGERRSGVLRMGEMEEEERRGRMEVEVVSKQAQTLRECLDKASKEGGVGRGGWGGREEEEGREAREEEREVAELRRELERGGEEVERVRKVRWLEQYQLNEIWCIWSTFHKKFAFIPFFVVCLLDFLYIYIYTYVNTYANANYFR